MADETKISWCDSTFNPWIGCSKVSPACDNCYAESYAKRTGQGELWQGKRRRTSAANWNKPLRWNELAGKGMFRQCTVCGRREFRKWDRTLPPGGLSCCSTPGCLALPESESDVARPRVFCASLADVFDNKVPEEWHADLMQLILKTPNLDWLLLTKRVGNAERLIAEAGDLIDYGEGWQSLWAQGEWPSNVWLGATVVNQEEADRDIPKLLNTPARMRFLSMEPLLGPVDLSTVQHLKMIDWVIVGGESGPKARPMHPDWVRSIRDQCAAAGVPLHVKQWGEWAPGECNAGPPTRTERVAYWFGEDWQFDTLTPRQSAETHRDDEPDMYRVGKKAAGRLLDGLEHNGFPMSEGEQ